MAEVEDKSLDDFFAKKDKSKKPKKKKKTKSSGSTETQSVTTNKAQGDEWNDFEEEKEKDYSGLKIQDLQVSEETVKEEQEEESADDEVDGTKKKTDDGSIWNAPASNSARPPAPVEAPSTKNVVSGKYIPPSVKRSTMTQQTKRKPGVPPDIRSQAMFPSLSAANQELNAGGNVSSDFEVVKRGTRSNDARMDDSRPRLDLGNRYDSLRS